MIIRDADKCGKSVWPQIGAEEADRSKRLMHSFKHTDITKQIIKAFYTVYNTLGNGFLEKVYENALIIELEKLGISARNQIPIQVFYDNTIIGDFFADLIVQNCVIVEIKAVKALASEHEAQLRNYLKATKFEIG